MNISRFFGRTNREAMRQVRLALGPDALIVSNQRVNGGVEILAADPTTLESAGQQASVASARPPASSSAELMREFADMRGAIETRMDALMWGNQLKQSSNTAVLFQFLLGCGFSTALLRAMLKQLPEGLSMRAAQEWVRSELARNLPVLSDEDALWAPGLTLALVGPTGVGKTTTVAKLAARAVERHGAEGVALLTTDTYRIGAYEQLKIYGELLQVPVRVVKNADDLTRVLDLIPDWVTVLIDNMGVSQRDAYVAEQAAMLGASKRAVTRLLVLNASSHGETLDEVARRYAREAGVSLHGCIISKIDEASSFGAGLDAAIRYRLPIHFVSTGQKVPEDLLHLDASELVERALGQGPDRRGLYSPTQDDLAALLSASEMDATRQARKQRASVDTLLTTLLAGSSPTHQPQAQQAFQQACDAVEEILPVAEAWDIWRGASDEEAPAPTVSQHLDRMFRTLRLAGHARPNAPVLGVHAAAPLKQAERQGRLHASLLFGATGQPLVSAVQQTAWPEGWWSSDGQSARQPPAATRAMAMQVEILRRSRPDWSVVHMFESTSRALRQQLEADGLDWLSDVSRLTRFYHQGVLATVSAIVRQLEHQPVNQVAASLGRSGRRRQGKVLWAATATVDSVARQRADQRLRLVSVQVVSRADGRVVRQLHAVAGASLAQTSIAELACWLHVASTARPALRSAASLIATANHPDSPGLSMAAEGIAGALLATQTALAAQAVLLESNELDQALRYLVGHGNANDITTTAHALTRLFALKKWLDVTAS